MQKSKIGRIFSYFFFKFICRDIEDFLFNPSKYFYYLSENCYACKIRNTFSSKKSIDRQKQN